MNAMFDLTMLAAQAEDLDRLCEGDERLFHDMMLAETSIDHVVRRIHEQIARDEEMLVGIKERQESLAERKKRVEARRDRAKAFVGTLLRRCHLNRLELPEVTYSVREGKPSLKVIDPDAVPEPLCRMKREPDKSAINEAYADAETLPNWLVRDVPKDVVTARTK